MTSFFQFKFLISIFLSLISDVFLFGCSKLERQEYGSEDEEDDGYGGYMAEEDESLALKLKQAFDDKVVDDLEIDDKYRVPADLLKDNEVKSKQLQDSAADLIRRCVEYADKYENENDDREVVIVEESSDESEVWDCETIVSTYSNLDNHPGKIEAPDVARKKKLGGTVSVALGAANPLISLKGKEKLPVDYLPRSTKSSTEKVKGGSVLRNEQPGRKQHGQESKEEKKERKASTCFFLIICIVPLFFLSTIFLSRLSFIPLCNFVALTRGRGLLHGFTSVSGP